MVRDAKTGRKLIPRYQRLSDKLEKIIDREIDASYVPNFRSNVVVDFLRFRGIPTCVQFFLKNKYERFGWDSVEFGGKGRGFWRIILTPTQERPYLP